MMFSPLSYLHVLILRLTARWWHPFLVRVLSQHQTSDPYSAQLTRSQLQELLLEFTNGKQPAIDRIVAGQVFSVPDYEFYLAGKK